MKKILVTGGAGFIGSHLVDRLIKEKYQVIVIDNLSSGRPENLNKKAKFYKIDILSPKINKLFEKEKPDVVIHLAAQINLRKSVKNPKYDARVNVLGSLNIIEATRKIKGTKFIFASSGGALYFGKKKRPFKEKDQTLTLSPYGIAKLSIEKYLDFYGKVYGLDWISLRLSNVYGPRQRHDKGAGVVAIFINNLLNHKPITIFGTGKQERDFIYVEDVVEAFIKVLKRNTQNFSQRIFNAGTQNPQSIKSLLWIISQLLSPSFVPKIQYQDAQKGEVLWSCLDISLIKKTFNWKPKYSLKEGLSKTIEWYLSLYKKDKR